MGAVGQEHPGELQGATKTVGVSPFFLHDSFRAFPAMGFHCGLFSVSHFLSRSESKADSMNNQKPKGRLAPSLIFGQPATRPVSPLCQP